ncbi:MAG: bifunctional 5,10-methylenetetrahydrofolate dehydrogenase/5,10-methenyltetrahydrofolate cyclohydrolase [Synergistaceae bacterium]|nr:bifunctional 5,10-methylenetetrahydrofolate dehydrogenase/5,10-methenyltetrahydrofolate cyclohydrolase [Synergistaceae bacterium]
MAILMRGTEVAAGMRDKLLAEVETLRGRGIKPTLAIVRVGARDDDMAYERGALKRCGELGIAVRVIELPVDIGQAVFDAEFQRVNEDASVHGILLFSPLPEHLSDEFARRVIDPHKDVDGMGFINMARVYAGHLAENATVFAPCTPSAVMEMLAHYGIKLRGKTAVVVGRSAVAGRPLAQLLLAAHATVTVCHSLTADLPERCRSADILVAAAGSAGLIVPDCVTRKSIVVDVGINVGPDGKLCGDVDFKAVFPIVSAISPVPGGVGAVTTSVLAKHVLASASSLNNRL